MLVDSVNGDRLVARHPVWPQRYIIKTRAVTDLCVTLWQAWSVKMVITESWWPIVYKVIQYGAYAEVVAGEVQRHCAKVMCMRRGRCRQGPTSLRKSDAHAQRPLQARSNVTAQKWRACAEVVAGYYASCHLWRYRSITSTGSTPSLCLPPERHHVD